MKIKYFAMLFSVIFIFMCRCALCGQYMVYGEFISGNLTITSYSPSWDDYMTEQLFYELQNNYISGEFSKLSHIYVYPDSPKGVNGEYIEDISSDGGEYAVGGNAVIRLYNGEKYRTLEDMSPILSHEYGHHYTIVNIIENENIYYSDWVNSEYGKIRGLENYDICFDKNSENYKYKWDVTEIAANDYYQLLGSKNGKRSINYPDTLELLEIRQYDKLYGTKSTFDKTAYNAMPQKNPDIPLAADTDGLYEYLVKIGGGTGQLQQLERYPQITDISFADTDAGRQYTAKWSEAQGNGPFEYTLIMYGKGSSLIPLPVKTTITGEESSAVFGCGTNGNETLERDFDGIYEFVIYIRDSQGFIYAAAPVEYDFSKAEKVTSYVRYPLRDGTMNDVFNAIIRILQKEENSGQ